jgi:hypothetical protein
MATVHGVLSVQLEDTMGVKASHELLIQISDATTLASVITGAQAYFALLDPLTDAAGVQARFTLKFASTGLKTGATVENPLGNGGLFTFGAVGTPYRPSILVPSMAEALITNGKIDNADSDVTAWANWIKANGTALGVESRGYQKIDAWLKSKIVTRKHRKEESLVSNEPSGE